MGRAAAGEGDHPPVRAARDGRLAAPELVRARKMGKPRPASARDPFRARGAEPLRDLEACLDAYIDAADIRAKRRSPLPLCRRPDRYAHRNGRSRTDPWRMVPSPTSARVTQSGPTRSNGSGFGAVSSLARRTRSISGRPRPPERGPLRDRAVAGFATSVGLRPHCLTHPATLSHPDWRGRSRLP
jgi:hypothetical protein